MRSKLLGLIVGAGLVAATALPALACPFNRDTSASNDQYTPRQTAQAQQQSSDTTTE